MRGWLVRLGSSALFAGVSALALSAFTLEPMSALLAPSGQGAVATFRVRNDGAERVAVRFGVLTRSVDAEGRESNSDAGQFFTVYPSRVVVEPRSSAAVKVQWKGPAKLETERAFRLVAENVALDGAAPASSGIKVMFRYLASVYVGESRFAPRLAASVRGAAGPDGRRGFELELRNEGSRHVVAESLVVEILVPGAAGSPPLLLSPEEIAPLSGANYLPGSPRRLFVPRAEAEPGRSYDARLSFEAEY